jgi:hypothetical protein
MACVTILFVSHLTALSTMAGEAVFHPDIDAASSSSNGKAEFQNEKLGHTIGASALKDFRIIVVLEQN